MALKVEICLEDSRQTNDHAVSVHTPQLTGTLEFRRRNFPAHRFPCGAKQVATTNFSQARHFTPVPSLWSVAAPERPLFSRELHVSRISSRNVSLELQYTINPVFLLSTNRF